MKHLLVIFLATLLAITLLGPAAVLSATDSGVKGEITVAPGDSSLAFSGHVQLLSDGTVAGQWQWTIFSFSGYPVKLVSNRLTDLSFPTDKTAAFKGSFTSNDLPLFTHEKFVPCELHFKIAPIGTEANPGGLPAGLPPGIVLPPGLEAGSSILLVYCSEGKLIATQQGNYQISVY